MRVRSKKFSLFFFNLLVFVIAVLLMLPRVARAELIDRIVASVNDEVITMSELNQAAGFNAALSGGGDEDRVRAETLEGLMNRKLLLQEAYRLRFVDVSDQEINDEIEKLRERLESDTAFADFLARLDISAKQLKRMLGERLLVERFIEKKIGLFIRVSRDEAMNFFKEHAGAFEGKQFPEVQKIIMSGLSGQKLEQQTARYIEELREKADVRVMESKK